MKKYFYSDGTQKHGPFTLEELKVQKVSSETLVWFEGLADWTPASQIDEITSELGLNAPPFPEKNSNKPSPGKKRHAFVTIWLTWGIIANLFFSFLYLFNTEDALMNIDVLLPSGTQRAAIIVLGVLSLLNVALYIFLFLWKKYGFYGFIGTSFFAFIGNLSLGYDFIWSLFGVIGIVILYYILQIKKEGVSAWTYLE